MGKNLSLNLDENKAMRKRLEELWDKTHAEKNRASKQVAPDSNEIHIDKYEYLDLIEKINSFKERMDDLKYIEDQEYTHPKADKLLSEMLEFLGTKLGIASEVCAILEAYDEVEKYYA
jgi:predicted house-cleaning noncanonical NTP pyrophosphatase (MazG superfamily)